MSQVPVGPWWNLLVPGLDKPLSLSTSEPSQIPNPPPNFGSHQSALRGWVAWGVAKAEVMMFIQGMEQGGVD